ncbi:MAG TPA: TonB-dependent receptor, partial [Longimicrobiales bacterium]|nr:TonB-dependent receptor [Longimicrobiales bacterium]
IEFPEFGDTRFRSRIEQGFARADVQWAAHRDLELRTGVEADRIVYANRAASGGTVFRQGSARSWLLGGYLQANWRPNSSWLVELGGRTDTWQGDRTELVAQPRIAVKHFVSPNAAVRLAAGRYGQFVHSIRDEELPVGIDIWVTTGERAPRVTSDQVQSGLEVFRGDWYFTLDGYYRAFKGVVTNNLADDPNTPLDDLLAGDGSSYGADLLLRKDAGPVRGFVSVSWLKAERSFPDPNRGIDPAPIVRYAPIFDRRLDLDLVLRTTLPRQWELGARFNFGTGLPYTRPLGSFLYYEYHIVQRGRRLISDRPDSARSAILLSDRNAERYPAYHRLDLSLRKTLQKSWGQLTPHLDVLNVLNRKNVLFYFYEYDRDPPIRSGVSMFPLLPTIGLEVVF